MLHYFQTLHPLLEDGCQGDEKPEPHMKVVIITNNLIIYGNIFIMPTFLFLLCNVISLQIYNIYLYSGKHTNV